MCIAASFAQQRLWFLEQVQPGTALYNIPSAFRVSGRFDLRALQSAVDGLVVRHESLRTTFAAVDGEPVQVIAPCVGVLVVVEGLGAAGAKEPTIR